LTYLTDKLNNPALPNDSLLPNDSESCPTIKLGGFGVGCYNNRHLIRKGGEEMANDETLTIDLDDQIKIEADAALAELGRSDTIATQAVFDNYESKWLVHFLNRTTHKRFSVALIPEEQLAPGFKDAIKQKLRELN
jgi:hypothetical protein